MCKVPRLRTIEASHAWLSEEDPESGITKGMLRSLVDSGEIPSVRQGRTKLINIDTLPDEIAKWVERKSAESMEKMTEPENAKPVPATERKAIAGKYGQIKPIKGGGLS